MSGGIVSIRPTWWRRVVLVVAFVPIVVYYIAAEAVTLTRDAVGEFGPCWRGRE